MRVIGGVNSTGLQIKCCTLGGCGGLKIKWRLVSFHLSRSWKSRVGGS